MNRIPDNNKVIVYTHNKKYIGHVVDYDPFTLKYMIRLQEGTPHSRMYMFEKDIVSLYSNPKKEVRELTQL